MRNPEMVVFDYGRTLVWQPDFNISNGNRAIYPYISKNPNNISFKEYDRKNQELFAQRWMNCSFSLIKTTGIFLIFNICIFKTGGN